MLKRVTGVVILTTVAMVVLAGSAIAQTSTATYPVSPVTSVEAAGGSKTAFTGSGLISFGTVMVVALVIAGLTALLVARRRAARLAG